MGLFVVIAFLLMTFLCGVPVYGWLIAPGKGIFNKPIMRVSETTPPVLSPAMIPLLGISALSAILSVITLLRVPIKYSAWPVLLFFMAIFVMYVIKHKNLYSILPKRYFWIGLALVLLCCGIGYYLSVTQYYRGNDYSDQTFYISQAQFYIDYPYDYDRSVFTNAPWVNYFWTGYNIYRYTTAFLAAFLSQICFAPDAGYVYAAHTIMLCILAFCAAYAVTERLNIAPWLQKWLPVSAACVSGFIMLPIDCFFPSGYSVALTIVIGLLSFDLARELTLKRVFAVSLLLSFSTAVYTEMTYMYIGLVLVALAAGVIKKQLMLRNAIGALVFPAVGCAIINVQQIYIYPTTMSPWWALQWGDVLAGIYNTYMNPSGITRLFFGYPQTLDIPLLNMGIGFVSICLLLAAFAGLVMLVFREKEIWSLSLLAVAVFPLLFISDNNDIGVYRFYRTFSQAAPIYVLGIGYFVSCWRDTIASAWFRRLLTVSVAALAFAGLMATSYITITKMNIHNNNKNIIANFKSLEQMDNENICYVGGWDINTRWDMYYARGNSVWGLARISSSNIIGSYDTFYDLSTLPLDDCKFAYSSGIVPMVNGDELRQVIIAALVDKDDRLIYTWGDGVYLDFHYKYIPTIDNTTPEKPAFSQLYMKVLSKGDINAILRLTCPANMEAPVKVEINGTAYTASPGEVLRVEIALHRGVQRIPIVSDGDCPFSWVCIDPMSDTT